MEICDILMCFNYFIYIYLPIIIMYNNYVYDTGTVAHLF